MKVYPTECVSIKRKNTFAVEARLAPAIADGEADYSPLEIFHPIWSRFVLKIIETGNTSVWANIPVRDIHYIMIKSNVAQEKEISLDKKEISTDMCNTIRLTMGQLKGKTPAEVLIEMGSEGVKLLSEQYKYLSANADKYPRNRQQMAAISEAAKKYKEGTLQASSGFGNLMLYDIPMKVLQYRKKPNGKMFVYSVQIRWEYGETNPLVVTIENYYANAQISQGFIKVDTASKEDAISLTFRMTASEWAYVCYQMMANMRMAEAYYTVDAIEESMNMERMDKWSEKLDRERQEKEQEKEKGE